MKHDISVDGWVVGDAFFPWHLWPYHRADMPEDDMLSWPMVRVMRRLRFEAQEAEQMAREHGLETQRRPGT